MEHWINVQSTPSDREFTKSHLKFVVVFQNTLHCYFIHFLVLERLKLEESPNQICRMMKHDSFYHSLQLNLQIKVQELPYFDVTFRPRVHVTDVAIKVLV